MVNCSKSIGDLKPLEALQCCWQAVGGSLRRIGDGLAGITIDQWGDIIFWIAYTVAIAPAFIASFFWPFILLFVLIGGFRGKPDIDPRLRWFGPYMVATGGYLLLISKLEAEDLVVWGGWQVMCGLSMIAVWFFGVADPPSKALGTDTRWRRLVGR